MIIVLRLYYDILSGVLDGNTSIKITTTQRDGLC